MARLSIVGRELDRVDASERPVVDDILFKVPRQGKRKRGQSRADNSHLRRHLEDEFLRPSTTFSPAWLNRFQQYGSTRTQPAYAPDLGVLRYIPLT